MYRSVTTGRFDASTNTPTSLNIGEKPMRPTLSKLDMRDLTGQVKKSDAFYFANGGFADVWKGDWFDTAAGRWRKVAVKVLRTAWTDPDYLAMLQRRLNREARVWSRLSHPNITPFYGACFDLGRMSTPCLVSPYLENGHANDYLKRHPEVDRLQLVTQIAAGLTYLHSLNPPVVHGDIKGSNVLVDDQGQALLSDFGLARILQSQGFTTKSAAGTCRWMAIELIMPEDEDETSSEFATPITTASDVWAFAMTALEILTGRLPFAEFKHDSVVVLNLIRGARPQRPEGIDNRIWVLLERCWQTNPSYRPTAQDVALCLDLIHHLVQGLDVDTMNRFLDSNNIEIHYDHDWENVPYPCKWNECLEAFKTLEECKTHEACEYHLRNGRFRTRATAAKKQFMFNSPSDAQEALVDFR